MPRHLISLFLCCLASTAIAQDNTRYVSFSNGTGFYVTKDGYIVTNAHVVKECGRNLVEVVSGATNTTAEIVSRDDATDLALLRSVSYAPAIATIRDVSAPLITGEPLIVMGYGGQAGLARQYSFVKASLVRTGGIRENPHLLEFTNAAQKGNSGGPLLDASGRVIGVIRGKTFYEEAHPRANTTPDRYAASDIAIDLNALHGFLERSTVRVRYAANNLYPASDNRIEYDARNYIVQLRCQTN